MVHVYINEVIGGEKDSYLLPLEEEDITAKSVRVALTNYFTTAWTYNPKLQSKVEKPEDYNVTVSELDKWVQECQEDLISVLPVLSIKGGYNWYLSYYDFPKYKAKVNASRKNDLRERISRLSEMSVELEEISQGWAEVEEDVQDQKEEAYQTLFSETVRLYGK